MCGQLSARSSRMCRPKGPTTRLIQCQSAMKLRRMAGVSRLSVIRKTIPQLKSWSRCGATLAPEPNGCQPNHKSGKHPGCTSWRDGRRSACDAVGCRSAQEISRRKTWMGDREAMGGVAALRRWRNGNGWWKLPGRFTSCGGYAGVEKTPPGGIHPARGRARIEKTSIAQVRDGDRYSGRDQVRADCEVEWRQDGVRLRGSA